MKLFNYCSKIIEYLFYLLFFLVPLSFSSSTSELFEFNKMWITFGLTIIIGACWIIKMILQRRILFCRTPLDVPIILFLLSQIISTIHSLDPHVSLWGYYSRFNGGLLSIISYIFLYYAFVSNFHQNAIFIIKRLLLISLASGTIVALWGLPSHFGHDPTCLLFRGTFDVSCWTDAFQPKVRNFSTLGQPNWLAVYLAILIPIAIAFALKNPKSEIRNPKLFENLDLRNLNLFRISTRLAAKRVFEFSAYLILIVLFFFDLLLTQSQSGFLGLVVGLIFFVLSFFYFERKQIKKLSPRNFILNYWYLLVVLVLTGSITFFVGQPIAALNSFTFSGIKNHLAKTQIKPSPQPSAKTPFVGELGGTDSGKIRLIVWQGAINIWKHNPLFGSGVETFAFAYYRYRPASHNLTSEWDYLYNKAHNEYLNYLATTGAFGLGSYLVMIGWFLFSVFKYLIFNIDNFRTNKSSIINLKSYIVVIALLASYVSILVSNFFGFSVVIVNIYFFLIPAFVFILTGLVNPDRGLVLLRTKDIKLSIAQFPLIIFVFFASSYLLLTLLRFWFADKAYGLGYNLDRAGEYQYGYSKLQAAISLRGDEPVFLDELANNSAILAAAFFSENDSTHAATLTNQAVKISDFVVANHPNSLTFWKTRTRIFYMLSSIDKQYLIFSLEALKKANTLAPTDAKISYNLGVLYEQTGEVQKAIKTLEKTIQLKPDYRDAYYALGLFYHEKASDKKNKTVDEKLEKKAVDSMRYILTHISSDDAQVKTVLESWK